MSRLLSAICVALLCIQHIQAFQINLVVGPNQAVSGVTASGTESHFTTFSERTSFGMSDEFLKSNIAGRMAGRWPDDVALSGPAYNQYGWTEVKTVLTATSAEIVSMSTQPVVLKNVTLINQSNNKGTFRADTSEAVQTTIQTSWSQKNVIDTTETLELTASFLGIGANSKTVFSYHGEWEKSSSSSQTTTLGSEEGVSVELKPGQQVRAILSASQGVMNVRVYYQAYLTGQVYYHYNKRWQGHYFYACDVTSLPIQPITISQDIQVNFYSEATVKLADIATGDKVSAEADSGVEDLIFV